MIAYSAESQRAATVAENLAAAFDLWCVPVPHEVQPQAVLNVVPACERRHHDPPVPEVVVPTAARVRSRVSGRIVLCGVADEDDAPAAATAATIACALVLALLGSATWYLASALDRPLLVCPRDPRPAMRVREVLRSSSACPA